MNHQKICKKLYIVSLILICRVNKVAKYCTKSPLRNNECLLISCQEMRHDVRQWGCQWWHPAWWGRARHPGLWVSYQPAPSQLRREINSYSILKWNCDILSYEHSEHMSSLCGGGKGSGENLIDKEVPWQSQRGLFTNVLGRRKYNNWSWFI